jgi:integrase
MNRKDKYGRKLRVGESYDEKNNRYVFRKMVNGQRYNLTNDDLQELRKEETKLLDAIDEDHLVNQNLKKLTLDEYYQIWCENAAKLGRKATTLTNYKAYYKAHILGKALGRMIISKIRKVDCQRLFNEMVNAGCKKNTLNNMKSCLSMIFADAEDDGAITRNPCRNIRFGNNDAKKRTAICDEQVDAFMAFIKDDEEFYFYYPFFLVLFNLGLRIGEACAITNDCVIRSESKVIINKTMNRYRKKDYGFTNAMSSPKSNKGNRTLVANDIVMAAFEQARKIHMKNGITSPTVLRVDDYGRIIGEYDNLVFYQWNGNLLNEPAVLKLLHRIVAKQNKYAKEGEIRLKYFYPHSARHTYTTLAYESGADGLEIAERLGHESEETSRTTYIHLRGKKKEEQDNVINQIRIC